MLGDYNSKRKASANIAIDLMSGDNHPITRIKACFYALRKHPNISLTLVGDKSFISENIPTDDNIKSRINIIASTQTVSMADSPKEALKKCKNTSMWHALAMVKTGHSQVAVSAGNTSALISFSKLSLGTIDGVDLPAIAVKLPTLTGNTLLIDAGGSIHCTAEQLEQFALLGKQWFIDNTATIKPRISLLNVGIESHKGDKNIKLAAKLLAENQSLNYIGYIEGNNILQGVADVVVCSGFVGNIALKTGEGVVNYLLATIKAEFDKNIFGKILLLLSFPYFKKIRQRIDPKLLNGAVLLGLNGLVVKSHGNADSNQFLQAVKLAMDYVG